MTLPGANLGSGTSEGRSETVLTRLSTTSFAPHASPLTPLQSQVDGLVTHFVEESANPRTLVALTAGGMAYRLGRIGVMGLGSSQVLRPLSVVVGLGTEVSAFEFTNRILQSVGTRFSSPGGGTPPLQNLWSWSGPGGWAQGLLNSTITFGLLKGAGFLAREQNIVLQHSFQSTAMVLGHQVVARVGLGPRPEGTLAEQFLQAEVTNLQLGAGMSLAHAVAPGVMGLEQGLDLSLQSLDSTGLTESPWGPRLAFASALSRGRERNQREGESSLDPLRALLMAMSSIKPPDGSGASSGEGGDVKEPVSATPGAGKIRADELDQDRTFPDLEAPSAVKRGRPILPDRRETNGYEPRIEAPEFLRRIPDEASQEILEVLGFLPDEVDRVNEEDLGRGVGEILEQYLNRTVLKLNDSDTIDLRFSELPAQVQRELKIVDEVVGIFEYAKRSNQRVLVEAALNAIDESVQVLYEDGKEILRRVLGPYISYPRGERASGDDVIQPHEAVLSIGSGDMMALLALLRHRIAPGEFSWRTRLLVSARSQEAANEINEKGTYRQNPNLKNIQINHQDDPPIEVVGPQGYQGLTRDMLQKSIRLQMLNVPSKKLHEILTEDYIRGLPENAILFEVIGGLIGPENRGIFQPGPHESPTVLPYQLIDQALERFGRKDVTVVSGGGFIPGKDLWFGRPVEMVFASRERGRGEAPEAEFLARIFAGTGLDNGYIRAGFTHHQHSTELGKALKNVTTLMAGLDAGRLARRIIEGALTVNNPQGEYETSIRTPIYQLMEGLLLYNEVGIKPNRVGYKSEVKNDYWRCSEINMEEVLRVMRLAASQGEDRVDIHNKKAMTEFLEKHIVQNPNKIASTRNPKRGLAQAVVEMWRAMGSPYQASDVMPEITEEGVDSQKPLIRLYDFKNHPYERRRLEDPFYNLYEAFHPGETLIRPPKIGPHVMSALQGKVSGISGAQLREALEGRNEMSLDWMERELHRLNLLRARTGTNADFELSWQAEIVHRLILALREGYEAKEVEHNPFSKPPYENAVLFRLYSSRAGAQKYHQVFLKVDGEQVMTRLTNLGMLLRSFEKGTQVKVALDIEGQIEPFRQMELLQTLQHILGTFAHFQNEGMELELSLRTKRGVQKIILKPQPTTREEVSYVYYDALGPLVDRIRSSPTSEKISPQGLRKEAALPSRLLDNLLKNSRVWPMLLDYVGGAINQGIRSALTRPDRASFIGIYAGGRLREVIALYRSSNNQPMVLSHSLTSRMAKANPAQNPDLTSLDFFDGQPLDRFMRDYENYAAQLNLGDLQYRPIPVRSLPLEEALVGGIAGVNPAVLWRFLREASPERDEMIERITPLYEKPITQARGEVEVLLKSYLDPFLAAHRAEFEADPVYQILNQYRDQFMKQADPSGSAPVE